ncbi:MAG: TIGR04149 family rSAM-modified RiPP [Bacteroidales bacterium]|nr:TIGR04149 family rSAM-modified RiPP [Bacteroidales bacterium]MBN2751062.1 TIGR04149 family rSAM-modified RiPP [Bacteroidales bacterium]
MKTLKLNKIEASKLNNREMNDVKGGAQCGCGCNYEGSGGSSSFDNGHANYSGGKFSGGVQTYWLEEVTVTP